MDQLGYNLPLRWFVGLEMDDPVWDVTVLTKNREWSGWLREAELNSPGIGLSQQEWKLVMKSAIIPAFIQDHRRK
jgi:hypothetical protein